MKSEDGTGGRHALWVLKEMWDCHPTYFIQTFRQVTSVICLFHYPFKVIHISHENTYINHKGRKGPGRSLHVNRLFFQIIHRLLFLYPKRRTTL